MGGDDLGAKERAWLVAGFGVVEQERDGPLLLVAEGERPVLVLPAGTPASCRELVYGWAMAELVQQHGGWLYLVRRLCHFGAAVGRVVVTAGLGWPALRLALAGLG